MKVPTADPIFNFIEYSFKAINHRKFTTDAFEDRRSV